MFYLPLKFGYCLDQSEAGTWHVGWGFRKWDGVRCSNVKLFSEMAFYFFHTLLYFGPRIPIV
jgi:hypothetical protein